MKIKELTLEEEQQILYDRMQSENPGRIQTEEEKKRAEEVKRRLEEKKKKMYQESTAKK